MSNANSQERAVNHVKGLVADSGPNGTRVVYCEVNTQWFPDMLRMISQHRLHVLAPAADMVVFFDKAGAMLGWRDDGRLGVEAAVPADEKALMQSVRDELGLPSSARMGKVAPRQLPPLGWTHQATIFFGLGTRPEFMARAWIAPQTLGVIQYLRETGEPLPAKDLPTAATGVVEQLFARRLRRGGVFTTNPEWYFRVSAGEPTEYDGGRQVRLKTWRHWSNADVRFDEATGELIGWKLYRYADPPSQAELDAEAAQEAARERIDLPDGARLSSARPEQFAPQRRVYRLEWAHWASGVRVDGDLIRVRLHPETMAVVETQRLWRTPTVAAAETKITEAQAVEVVEAKRHKLRIDPEMDVEDAELAIVEYKRNRDRPGPTEDRMAWIVRLVSATGWVEVHVDAIRRKVLAVIRSA